MGQRVATVCAMALTALASAPARAELDYSFEVGAGHSDNISRVAADEIDETIATAGLNLDWEAARPRLQGSATVDLSYFDYLDNTYDSEFVGTADGTAVFGIVPGRFTWLVQDSFGQARDDPFAPVSPENRENINYFTTGPDLIATLGRTGRARLFGRYSVSTYERSPLDADRVLGGFAIGRQIAANSEFAFNAVREQVKFDDENVNTDQDRDSLFLSYSVDGSRTSIDLEAGYTWLEFANGNESDGTLFRLVLNREISSASNVWLSLGSQLTDAADALRATVSGEIPRGAQAITATSDPFQKRVASAGWNFSRNRTTLELGVAWDDDEYETQTQFDRTSLIWSASLERNISPKLTAGVLVSLTDEEFDTTGQQADEWRYGFNIDWRFARTVGLRLLAERYDRESSGANPLAEFVESRVFLTVFYRPRRPTTPQ